MSKGNGNPVGSRQVANATAAIEKREAILSRIRFETSPELEEIFPPNVSLRNVVNAAVKVAKDAAAKNEIPDQPPIRFYMMKGGQKIWVSLQEIQRHMKFIADCKKSIAAVKPNKRRE